MPYVGIGAQRAGQNLSGASMMKAYAFLGVSILLILIVTVMGKHHSQRLYNHLSFPTVDEVHYGTTHHLFNNFDPEVIKKNLRDITKEPHVAGTEANKRTAYTIARIWAEAGLEDVHTLSYDVLLSYPDFNVPNTIEIRDGRGKKVFKSKGVSPVVIPDEQSDAGHQWLAFAGNGTVTADVVYCNRGSENDFKNLKIMGVSVEGKIVLVRYGEGFRANKVSRAQKHGAIGAIIFSDPSDVAVDGTDEDHVYPKTIWMPNEGVQRGTLMESDGDPLTPNYPAKKELYRSRTIDEAKAQGVIPSIPVLPISYTSAYQILSRMTGRIAPTDWQGAVAKNITYKLGPGFRDRETLTISVSSYLTTKKIRNVIGYIRGSQEPDRYVILGNHYDAWVYGSLDPNSGTATLGEVARAMMKTINETSWRPARTIVFAAWDAEEYGLIGSTEFVEEFVDILQKRAVVYINMDTIYANSSLHVQTVPSLENVAIDIAKRVPNPSRAEVKAGRRSVYDTWVRTFPGDAENRPLIELPNGGSDQAPFLNYAGIPVINFCYKNVTTRDTYPLYHTMYETPFTNIHLMDTDNLAVHTAIGQYWAELGRYFADEAILPINISMLATTMLDKYLPNLRSILSHVINKKADFDLVRQQYQLLVKNTHELRRMTEKFDSTIKFTRHSFSQNPYDAKDISAVNERLISSERCFINPRGVSKKSPSARHVLFSVSDADSYSNTVMAGVMNALNSYKEEPTKINLREILNQISIVQYSVICVVNTLRDVI